MKPSEQNNSNRDISDIKDVVGIGNAMVDILAPADEKFLEDHNLVKGAMTLIGAQEVINLQDAMNPELEISGGSVGNTMAGIASLGGTGSYIGKVRDDQLGAIFNQDLESMGITFNTERSVSGAQTARCLVIVTPDGQRSMATYLGACLELSPDDIDISTILGHRVTYLEGYLWDGPQAKESMIKAARLAHSDSRQVALTLSDSFCVDRHRESFRDLIYRYVDILFANEQEIVSLYEVSDVHVALDIGRRDCNLMVITRGAEPALIASEDDVRQVSTMPVERVVDTTGAGDLYAAGFLFGITHGYDPVISGRIGAIAAGEIISHFGARPETNLQELVRQTL